ncbi:hypothetical protein A3K73_07605 [Candidatus Pacearchaeota archaeon RBG_13_36_9]|nr:MAG: hypothetical protein A3K73_07605 [Candidatus Pacearchaeota archaeon RBG_13_36_9]
MVRDDIVAGLKNGLERGVSIETAKQSLLNAGYSADEVQEGVNSLNSDSVLAMQQPFRNPASSVQPSPRQMRPQNQPVSQQASAKKEGGGFFAENWKIISLVVVLILLMAAFAIVLLFKDTISGWFG